MLLLASFVLDGDKLSTGQVKNLQALDPKLSRGHYELILFFNQRPNRTAAKLLGDCRSITYYWPKTHKTEPVQKAVLCAAGAWIIFTSFENLIKDHKTILEEVKKKNAGYIICRFNQRISGFLKEIGIRDISSTPYIAIERHLARRINYNGAKFNFNELMKLADRHAGVSFIYSPDKQLPDFLGYKIIFFRSYLRMAMYFTRRAIRWFLRKTRSFPRYVLIKVRARIQLARVKPIDYSPTIPVFIITRDRLEPLKILVKWIEDEGLNNIIFIDNSSTYPPLLKYFEQTPYEVVKLPTNVGKVAPWQAGITNAYAKNQPFIVTDPDIIPDEGTHEAIKQFIHLLNKYRRYVKVGFALHIDDLPDNFDLKQNVVTWESQFWKTQIEKDVYDAPIDTTFALYRANTPYTIEPAIRTGRIQARHEPWYTDSKNPSEELFYYRAHADTTVGTWGLKEGDLSDFYLDYQESQGS